jgi:hypothetical protein
MNKHIQGNQSEITAVKIFFDRTAIVQTNKHHLTNPALSEDKTKQASKTD